MAFGTPRQLVPEQVRKNGTLPTTHIHGSDAPGVGRLSCSVPKLLLDDWRVIIRHRVTDRHPPLFLDPVGLEVLQPMRLKPSQDSAGVGDLLDHPAVPFATVPPRLDAILVQSARNFVTPVPVGEFRVDAPNDGDPCGNPLELCLARRKLEPSRTPASHFPVGRIIALPFPVLSLAVRFYRRLLMRARHDR